MHNAQNMTDRILKKLFIQVRLNLALLLYIYCSTRRLKSVKWMSQPSTIIRITFYVKAISPADINFYLSITQRIKALLVALGLIVP